MLSIWKKSLLIFSIIVLSACQSLPVPLPFSQLQNNSQAPTDGNVNLYCEGVNRCEFTRVDNTQILDADTGWITLQAISQGLVRLKTSSVLADKRLSFYLTVPAKRHEIAISYYPISKYRVEKFTVIHNFVAGHNYKFQMYRQENTSNGSLFNVSAPEPLCVNLWQDNIVIRRFCRPVDALTGLGEFIEQKVN